MSKLRCFNCHTAVLEVYYTDCFEGFGSVGYCADCLIEGAKAGFNDPKTICICGKKMILFGTDETIIKTVEREGILFYICENCLECPNEEVGIGLYLNQRSEVIDKVFNDEVHPDELEHEYVYDLGYAFAYHNGNPHLFDKPYDPNWRELLKVK